MGIHQRTHLCMAKSRAAIVHVCSAAMVALALSFPVDATLFTVTNLVTDNQGVNAAQMADPKLINAWGISHSAGSPFWISDNGTGFATLYNVNPATNVTTTQGPEVSVAGAGNVTGQAFANIAGNFNSDAFLFVREDRTVSGWKNALGTAAEMLQSGGSGWSLAR